MVLSDIPCQYPPQYLLTSPFVPVMLSEAAKLNLSSASETNSRRQTDLYREIFTHSTEPIAIIGPDGLYREQNEAHFKLLGYTDEELKSQTPAIHMGVEKFAEVVRELQDKGEYRGELMVTTKAGETRLIELSAFTMRDGNGDPLCHVGIKRDITERKEAELVLQRREAELSDFFDNATIGMHWAGPDGTVLRANPAELNMFGYTHEEYVGHNIAEFHADQKTINEILTRLRSGEVLQNCQARMRCKDGRIKHVSINSSVYYEGGKFVHTRCFTRDITDRKRTARRLALQYAVTRILAESADVHQSAQRILRTSCETLDWEVGVLWTVDAAEQVLRCADICHADKHETPQFDQHSKSLVFKKGVGLPGTIWQTRQPTWIDNVVEAANFPRAPIALREGLRGAFGFPILMGQDVWGVVEFFSSEMREPDEELMNLAAGIGGQIGQFTQRRLAETERAALFESERAARAEAEKANRLKDEFLATLSHELRTPLNAVIGWARMLRSGRLDRENSNHAMEVIERNAWAQKQIIEDILDVSRVITGKLQLNLSPVDPVSVVDAALDAVRPAMEAKDIKIETVIDASLRLISGDADRLQQVVWNILSNAAKFTPFGGRVVIAVKQTEKHVVIRVEDSGPGIQREFLPHVFERFRQADGSTTRTHGGLGLGLAIVRHLVELHGGTIAVDNIHENGGGAVFTVQLPLPSGELPKQTLHDAADAFELNRDQPNLEGLSVLVVDDETDALDLITVELAQHGAQVVGVTSAEEALTLLDGRRFDLLISDIGMPKIDGFELIRRVRGDANSERRRIPAVALTAYARVQDRMKAIRAGYSTHIAKPVEANELLTIVASLAGRLDRT